MSSKAVFLEEQRERERARVLIFLVVFCRFLLLSHSSQTFRKSLSFPVRKYPTEGSIRGVEPIDSIIYLYQESNHHEMAKGLNDAFLSLLTVHGIPSS